MFKLWKFLSRLQEVMARMIVLGAVVLLLMLTDTFFWIIMAAIAVGVLLSR